jgi:hypothetical protein
MSCCGKNQSTRIPRYQSVTPATPPQAPVHGVSLRYIRASTILVRGPRTGRVYTFTPESPEQDVAPADVEVLLRTGLFTAGG